MTLPDAIPSRFPESLAAEFEHRTAELLSLAWRYEHLANIEAALLSATRGKSFHAHGGRSWWMLLGERTSVIIDLASWVKGMHAPRSRYHDEGFLRRVAKDPAGRAALASSWTNSPPENDAYLAAAEERLRLNVFGRLFPHALASVPEEKDVGILVVQVCVDAEPLRVDRNDHRAHRFEGSRTDKPNALGLQAVRAHLDRCEALVQDLYFLSTNCTFSGASLRVTAGDSDAEDVVDLILRGPIERITYEQSCAEDAKETRYYQVHREAHYERLHAKHDAAGAPEDAPFNFVVLEEQ